MTEPLAQIKSNFTKYKTLVSVILSSVVSTSSGRDLYQVLIKLEDSVNELEDSKLSEFYKRVLDGFRMNSPDNVKKTDRNKLFVYILS